MTGNLALSGLSPILLEREGLETVNDQSSSRDESPQKSRRYRVRGVSGWVNTSQTGGEGGAPRARGTRCPCTQTLSDLSSLPG